MADGSARFRAISGMLLAAMLVVGCQSARVTPQAQRLPAAQDPTGIDFWHALPGEPLASNHDAFRAVLMYFDGQAPAEYDAKVELMKQRGWLPAGFNEPADVAVTRGTLAIALTEAMGLEGGVMMRVLGPQPRYAVRELQYIELYPICSPQQAVSGTALVELFSRLEDYQRRRGTLAAVAVVHQTPKVAAASGPVARIVARLIASPVWLAQAAVAEDEPNPAPAQAPTGPIVITEVSGIAQVRLAADQPWAPAAVGQQLPIGAEFRTGPRSKVQFKIGDTQTVTLDRLGTAKLIDVVKPADGKLQTNIGMKYGRSTLQVQAAGVEHESKIRSPGATLAVRGSIGVLEEVGQTLKAAGLEGDVAWAREPGWYVELPPDSLHEGDQTATAQNRIEEGTFDPSVNASTPEESELYARFPSGRFQQRFIGVDEVQRLLREVQAAGIPSIEGLLSVVLEYHSLSSGPADVNLRMRTPTGARISARESSPLFFHSGDTVSRSSDHVVRERIVSRVPVVPTGAYRGAVANQGPNPAAGQLKVEFIPRPGAEPVVIHYENFSQIPSLPPATFDFDIPPENRTEDPSYQY